MEYRIQSQNAKSFPFQSNLPLLVPQGGMLIVPSNEYDEGAQFARQNGYLYKNPYPIGSTEYNDFERGWSQEIKKNPEAVAHADALRKREKTQLVQKRKKTTGAIRESYRKEKMVTKFQSIRTLNKYECLFLVN